VTEEALAALGGRRVGLHLPLGGGMVKTADRAGAIGATAIQVFSDNPTAWRRRNEPPAELPAFRARLEELDIAPLSVHGPYLVNLAGADAAFWARSVETLVGDLAMARRYGARFLNFHVGSHRGSGPEAGIRRIAQGLAAVLSEVPADAGTPRLVLENSAGGGDGVGGTIEELAAMLDATAAAGVDSARIGFCLDTAHLWGAGYDVSRPEVVDQVLRAFDARLGARQLAMIHLNDSRSGLGSHTDRHQHVGAGLIGAAGLGAFLWHPRLQGVPLFAEPPGMDEGFDAVNMDRIRLLVRGEELPPLGPEAFAPRGSRTRGAHPRTDDSDAVNTPPKMPPTAVKAARTVVRKKPPEAVRQMAPKVPQIGVRKTAPKVPSKTPARAPSPPRAGRLRRSGSSGRTS
jgi:deoxyribonuclease IV